MNKLLVLVFGCLSSTVLPRVSGQTTAPVDYTVQATASVRSAPPQILLQWPQGRWVTGYTVNRREAGGNWQTIGGLGGGATEFADNNVQLGRGYEYQISKTTERGFTGYGYLYAGIEVSPVESRGKIIVAVDNRFSGALSAELERFQRDLVGDGWQVVRRDLSSDASVGSVKSVLEADYNSDRQNTKAILLFGHLAAPYSGNIYPDGHLNHQGAWPADMHYGEFDGGWTDQSVQSTSAERQINHNVPGDGKFDQNIPPSDVDVAVGRVDFWQMTNFSNKSPARSELDLLRQYLNKNHEFRHGRIAVARRALIADMFPDKGTDPVGNSGWRNFSAFVGPANIQLVGWGEFIPTATSQSFLAYYGAGGGSSYTIAEGVVSSDDFSTKNVQVIFGFQLGSFFGDWNNESNLLRSGLGSGNLLAMVYAGFPHWMAHHMALGETIGFATKLTQNNRRRGLHPPHNQGAGEVHITLLGDPTLRLHPVAPASDLRASPGSSGVQLSWSASPDPEAQTYLVFRSSSPAGPFARVGTTSGRFTSMTDPAPAGTFTYMVRAQKLERSPAGSYFNLSQGIFANATSTGGSGPTPPAAPSSLSAQALSSASISLSWSDNSSDETGFRLERRSGAEGFVEIAHLGVDARQHADNSVAAGTQYFYRVRAANNSGTSAYSNEASAITPAQPITLPPPSNLRAEPVNSTQIHLAWQDNSSDETGFELERRASEGAYARIASLGPNATQHSDSNVNAGGQYFYRVRALKGIAQSAFSNEAQATVPAGGQPAGTARFLKSDSATQGTWPGTYGGDGYQIVGGNRSLPSYASVQPSGETLHTWTGSTSDVRALLTAPGASRIAAAWYAASEFNIAVQSSTAGPVRVALYFVDWDRGGRSQTVELIDPGTGQALNTQTLSQFEEGKYLVWEISGAVRVRIAKTSGLNAVVSGIFFDSGTAASGVKLLLRSGSGGNLALEIQGRIGQTIALEESSDLRTWQGRSVHELQGSSLQLQIVPKSVGDSYFRARVQ